MASNPKASSTEYIDSALKEFAKAQSAQSQASLAIIQACHARNKELATSLAEVKARLCSFRDQFLLSSEKSEEQLSRLGQCVEKQREQLLSDKKHMLGHLDELLTSVNEKQEFLNDGRNTLQTSSSNVEQEKTDSEPTSNHEPLPLSQDHDNTEPQTLEHGQEPDSNATATISHSGIATANPNSETINNTDDMAATQNNLSDGEGMLLEEKDQGNEMSHDAATRADSPVEVLEAITRFDKELYKSDWVKYGKPNNKTLEDYIRYRKKADAETATSQRKRKLPSTPFMMDSDTDNESNADIPPRPQTVKNQSQLGTWIKTKEPTSEAPSTSSPSKVASGDLLKDFGARKKRPNLTARKTVLRTGA